MITRMEVMADGPHRVELGSSAKVAFVETLLRDAADGRGDDCVLQLAEIEARSLASIRVRDPLRLVDLAGDGGLRMGVPSDVVGASDQTLRSSGRRLPRPH